MTTWRELATRRGQLIEMQMCAADARRTLEALYEDYPDSAKRADDLKDAIVSLERVEVDLYRSIRVEAKS